MAEVDRLLDGVDRARSRVTHTSSPDLRAPLTVSLSRNLHSGATGPYVQSLLSEEAAGATLRLQPRRWFCV